ncbi:hypothetical protein MRB53_017475 [Persea americana]|uniref:Uncharacterized protein n=1 Tax=Persea americana TaxID=3435 RepID=A0ACC2M4S1_PERAE|nr:hypothetical protein MRB53_017475 [Persea americana]
MGRAPCCDKANVKKGPWSPEEDAKLKAFIEKHGTGGNWIALPQKIGLKRCGKSCRLRWLNYLRPNIKHGGFSEEEENIICSLYISIGSRWSIIAAQLPGRTDNDIKNYWNTRLKKKLLGRQKEQQLQRPCNLQQELKKASHNFIAPTSASQNVYWPEPVASIAEPYPYQDPHLNDHASTGKLLIRLGGRLSDSDQSPNMEGVNLQSSLDISTFQRLHENSMSSFNETSSPLLNTQYSTKGIGMPISQGPNSFPVEIGDMIYCNPQRLEVLDSCYGVGMMNHSNETSSAERTIWGDIGNSVYPLPLEDYQPGMLQECLINESRYLVSQ